MSRQVHGQIGRRGLLRSIELIVFVLLLPSIDGHSGVTVRSKDPGGVLVCLGDKDIANLGSHPSQFEWYGKNHGPGRWLPPKHRWKDFWLCQFVYPDCSGSEEISLETEPNQKNFSLLSHESCSSSMFLGADCRYSSQEQGLEPSLLRGSSFPECVQTADDKMAEEIESHIEAGNPDRAMKRLSYWLGVQKATRLNGGLTYAEESTQRFKALAEKIVQARFGAGILREDSEFESQFRQQLDSGDYLKAELTRRNWLDWLNGNVGAKTYSELRHKARILEGIRGLDNPGLMELRGQFISAVRSGKMDEAERLQGLIVKQKELTPREERIASGARGQLDEASPQPIETSRPKRDRGSRTRVHKRGVTTSEAVQAAYGLGHKRAPIEAVAAGTLWDYLFESRTPVQVLEDNE